ncbi:MAG: hypothetical protein ACAH95_01710 [Fimbriimonas sp.]
MSETRMPLLEWTVDYGDGRDIVDTPVPHAWRQDVPIAWEGPALYRTSIDIPRGYTYLYFAGVSYQALVYIQGELVHEHKGIWDSFCVPTHDFEGRRITLEVKVTKNGGSTFPVKDVASGFLPFVFHTFGGIHGEVELVQGRVPSDNKPFDPRTRFKVEGSGIFVDGKPYYTKGLLHWGWFPQLGHTNPPEDLIRKEVRQAKELGFNLVKFCLWVPPHRYLRIMREEGMEAWLELPLWDPTDDPARQQEIASELERIVRQYRHHENILIWTVGCELSASTSAEYRQYLTQLVRNLTGSELVKDNSGGAEMYGGDLREFGDFYDFHPYCDTHFYAQVLDALLPGPRLKQPVLLGEFNDIDVHRDLADLGNELPYWVSSLPELNDQGVRWQQDLPTVLAENRFSLYPVRERHGDLMESSRKKALFMRKTVHEMVRARDEISGYVITGWRDTPISSAGFFDDWDRPRFSPEECEPWNGEAVLFMIPTRRPPWLNGGNRPGWLDSYNFFQGQLFWRIGIHSQERLHSGLVWRLRRESGEFVAYGTEQPRTAEALHATEIGQISHQCDEPGAYVLEVEFGGFHNEWRIWVTPKPDVTKLNGWRIFDPPQVFPGFPSSGKNLIGTTMPPDFKEVIEVGGKVMLFLRGPGTITCPFWREAAFEFKNEEFWSQVPFAERWERLMAVCSDRALDPEWLETLGLGKPEILMNRIDVRTYKEHPVVVRYPNVLITTLRPYGGQGTQPTALNRNPAGVALLESLVGTV